MKNNERGIKRKEMRELRKKRGKENARRIRGIKENEMRRKRIKDKR